MKSKYLKPFLIPLFFLLFLSGFSCQLIFSFFDDVEVGTVPQEVEDVFVESPAGIKVEVWQKDLEIPWSLVFLPDGDALVSERPGRIRIIRKGKLQKEPYASIEHVAHRLGSEAGLMGLALHPDFPAQPYVYVKYTHEEGGERDNRVIRLRHDNATGTFDKVILKGLPAAINHNGGRIQFGPDGMLYIGTGEIFQRALAQNMESLGGKILRITPEGDVPDDNPFPGSKIFSLGHRNPQGLTWHPESGDLFSSEHGPSGEMGLRGRDIINIIHSGKNYGWPLVVGKVNKEGFEDPVIMWETATPPSGMTFWNNDLFVATLRSKALIRVQMSGGDGNYKINRIERWFASAPDQGKYGRLRDAVTGPDGALYVLTNNRDGRGNPKGNDDRILRISQ